MSSFYSSVARWSCSLRAVPHSECPGAATMNGPAADMCSLQHCSTAAPATPGGCDAQWSCSDGHNYSWSHSLDISIIYSVRWNVARVLSLIASLSTQSKFDYQVWVVQLPREVLQCCSHFLPTTSNHLAARPNITNHNGKILRTD